MAWYNSPATGNDWVPQNPVNGSEITSWNDTSLYPIQHNLIANLNQEPEYTTNVQNGLPAIFYDGFTDRMSATSFSELGSKTGATMFIVCKFLDNTSQQTVSTTNMNDFNLSVTGATIRYNVRMAGGVGTDTTSSVDTNFHLHTVMYDSTLFSNDSRLKYYRDQVQRTLNFGTTTVGASTDALSSILYISQSQLGTQLFYGYIAEIIIYDRTLSNDERLIVEDYLLTKWNL